MIAMALGVDKREKSLIIRRLEEDWWGGRPGVGYLFSYGLQAVAGLIMTSQVVAAPKPQGLRSYQNQRPFRQGHGVISSGSTQVPYSCMMRAMLERQQKFTINPIKEREVWVCANASYSL